MKILSLIFKKLGVFIILLLVCVVLSILSPNFFTFKNLINIIRQAAIMTVVATGLSIVMIGGGIDLSVGSVVGVSSAVLGVLIVSLGVNVWVAIIFVLLIGLLIGFINGVIVTRFNLAPFIVTLAGLTAYRGVSYIITRGHPITNVSPVLVFIGREYFFKVPVMVWIAFGVVIIMHILLSNSKFGIRTRQIGTDREAALFNGISVNNYQVITYSICGMLAAFGGIMLCGRLNSSQPNAGSGYELDAIAAVVIGGGSLFGGVGTIWGTTTGVLIIVIIRNGLNLLDVNVFWQYIATGAIILGAVLMDSFRKKVEEK